MVFHITLVLFLLMVCNNYAAKLSPHCKRLVTKDHLKHLSELIDTQMKSSCQISFNYVEESELNHPVCFLKAAYGPLGDLLRSEMKFKENTANSRIHDMLLESHDNLEEECFKTKADERKSSARCIKKFSLSAEEMLELVRRYFSLSENLIFKGEDFSQDCRSIFRKCSDSQNEASFSSACEEEVLKQGYGNNVGKSYKNEHVPGHMESKVALTAVSLEDHIEPGVVTDQDCECPSTSPITRGLVPSFLPTFESLPSIADHLGSEEEAASTLQLFKLPGTMQTQDQSEGSTKPRVPRSTYKGPSLDTGAAAVAYTAMSSAPEELVLAAVSQGPDPVAKDTAAFQDLTLTSLPSSPRANNIPRFPASQQQTEFMGTESAFPGSGAGSSQIWLNELPSQHLSLSGTEEASPTNQWLQQTRDVARAIPELPSDTDRTDSSSMSSLSLQSFVTPDPLDSSGVPSSGTWAVLPSSDPALAPILSSEEPFSTTRQSFRASLRQIPPDSYSRGEQSSQGQGPRIQQSTQLRERRAGREEEGLAKDREPEDSLSGPNFDLSFIPPNTDKSSKKPELRDSQRMTLIYVLVPSVLGILLAVGGLLFYLHKSRMLARRQQQRMGSDMEEQEGSPLRREEEHLELQMQGEL